MSFLQSQCLLFVVGLEALPTAVSSSACEKLQVRLLLVAEVVVVDQNMDFDAETLAHLLEVVGDTEAAFREAAMVKIATPEATLFNDGDLVEMATELFDFLAMTVKDDAFTITQGITDSSGIEAWRRMVARHVSTSPATALVAVFRVVCPPRPMELMELEIAI